MGEERRTGGEKHNKTKNGRRTKPYELGSSLADWDEEQEIDEMKEIQKTENSGWVGGTNQ